MPPFLGLRQPFSFSGSFPFNCFLTNYVVESLALDILTRCLPDNEQR